MALGSAYVFASVLLDRELFQLVFFENVYPCSYISSIIISFEIFLYTTKGALNVAEAKPTRSRFLHLTYLKGTIIQAQYFCTFFLLLHKCSLLLWGGGRGGKE